LVLHQREIISAALFFKYGIFGHYHLAGRREKYQTLSPNNFLIYNTALYLKKMGVKFFHLGGGIDSNPDNSLYRFKKRFSGCEYPFYIGKMVFDEEAYKRACNRWEEKFPDKKEKYKNFLLKYRY